MIGPLPLAVRSRIQRKLFGYLGAYPYLFAWIAFLVDLSRVLLMQSVAPGRLGALARNDVSFSLGIHSMAVRLPQIPTLPQGSNHCILGIASAPSCRLPVFPTFLAYWPMVAKHVALSASELAQDAYDFRLHIGHKL